MRLIDADALRKYFEVPHELKCGIQAGMDEYALKCIDEQPTITAPCWHKVEEPPKEDGWYMLGFLSRWRNGSWWIPKFPDYWMAAGAQKEE